MAKKRQRRPRGQIHLTQDPRSLIWYATGTLKGRRIRQSLGTSSKEHAEFLRSQVEREHLEEIVHGRKAVSTFDECVEHYLKVHGSGVGDSMLRFLPKLRAEFGTLKAKDVTSLVVQAYATRSMPNTKNTSKNTAIVNPTITVLRFAAAAGLCDVPMIQRFPENDATVVKAAPQKDIDTFLASSARLPVRAIVALLTTSACRCVEALRLDWDEIDLERCQAVLPPNKTKTDEPRMIYFPQLVADLLQALKDGGQKGGPFKMWGATRTALHAIQTEFVRLKMPAYGTHQIGRHAFAERLLGQGRTLKQVQEGAGWKDIKTLSDRYGHLEQSQVADIVRESGAAMFRGGLKVVKGGKE